MDIIAKNFYIDTESEWHIRTSKFFFTRAEKEIKFFSAFRSPFDQWYVYLYTWNEILYTTRVTQIERAVAPCANSAAITVKIDGMLTSIRYITDVKRKREKDNWHTSIDPRSHTSAWLCAARYRSRCDYICKLEFAWNSGLLPTNADKSGEKDPEIMRDRLGKNNE